jgi:DNA-directed RNA polymerase specialized sigma24 family protein
VRDIVEQAMRGDREAFGVLVGQTSDRMYAIAARILRDTHLAEDALQSAFITGWHDLPSLRDPDRFEAWMRKLVVRIGMAAFAERDEERATSSTVILRASARTSLADRRARRRGVGAWPTPRDATSARDRRRRLARNESGCTDAIPFEPGTPCAGNKVRDEGPWTEGSSSNERGEATTTPSPRSSRRVHPAWTPPRA